MKEIVFILLVMVLNAHMQSISSVYLRSELNNGCWIELLY